MTVPLRSPPDGDPRPRRLDMDVVLRSVRRHTEISQWAKRRLYDFGDDPDYAVVALAEAIEHGDGDAARAEKALYLLQKWEPDFLLQNHIASAIRHLPECRRYLMLCWVIRTGIRFPARVGDLVLFQDAAFNQRKGRVLKLDHQIAAATIESENGTHGDVLAEHVLANLTNGAYGHMRTVPPRIALVKPTASVKPCDTE